MSSKKNTKQQRTLHGGLRIPKEQQRKGGGQSRNGERWDEKGPWRNRSTLSRALLFKMCTCGWKNPARASVVISPPAGAHLRSWDLWSLGRESPPGPRLTPFCNWSPRPPPPEPFNEGWHLAEAGIEARPFNGSRSQKVLASQEHRFCHMFPPVSAMHPQGWRLQLATGRDATCGWRPWVSQHQSLVGGQNRDAQSKAQGPFLDWALWMSSAREMLSGQQRSQPPMGTNWKVKASLLCHTPIICDLLKQGAVPCPWSLNQWLPGGCWSEV